MVVVVVVVAVPVAAELLHIMDFDFHFIKCRLMHDRKGANRRGMDMLWRRRVVLEMYIRTECVW